MHEFWSSCAPPEVSPQGAPGRRSGQLWHLSFRVSRGKDRTCPLAALPKAFERLKRDERSFSNPYFGRIGSIAACFGSVSGVGSSFRGSIRYVEAYFCAGYSRKVGLGQPALLALHPGRKTRRLPGGVGFRGRQYGHAGPQRLERRRYEAGRQGHRYRVTRAQWQSHRIDERGSIAKRPSAESRSWYASSRGWCASSRCSSSRRRGQCPVPPLVAEAAQ